ncbi:MAG: Tat (twin-arginine translocation) pathway signal sequence containing protein [Flammeovirgaceae bacterium]|nr:Tat (twin-arginine translocation) pathway signal sequence containing protein [Flammeovirgaceae bacterium]
MKNNNKSRRKFFSAMALGVTATSLPFLTNTAYAASDELAATKFVRVEDWFDQIKGSHRIVYDGSTPHGGLPVIWNWAFYASNNETGSADSDITAMTVFRHSGLMYAFNDQIWKKYQLGAIAGVNDPYTDAPSLRNTVYEPKEKDFPLPGIDGVKRLQERGALFCACNLATKVFSSVAAKNMNLDPIEVYNDWVNGLLPGIQLVPSGVWALGRAQEKGCGYIFAGG